MTGHKLLVHMIQAHGLKHLNHFTGDHPYCVCEVKHSDSHAHPTTAETQPVRTGDALNPVWDEAFEIDPWQEGESIEFTIYDKGLMGAKTQGRVLLPAESFFPNGFCGTLNISGLPEASLQVDVQVLSDGAAHGDVEPSPDFTVQTPIEPSPDLTAQTPVEPSPDLTSQPPMAPPMTYSPPSPTTGPQRLGISILEAHGLQHMNYFTGDHPYVTCEIKHIDQSKSTKIETKPVTEGDVQNPFWGETHYLDCWNPGEPLEFSVYDKGLIGSKTEGKAVLPAELFSPQGFIGMIPISGLPHALLHVIVRVLGPDAPAQEEGVAQEEEGITQEEGGKKTKKLKKRKRSKGCC
jgi:hypothetical protein